MAPLITKVRELTNAAISDFSDDQVQGFLDRHRIEFRYEQLCPLVTRAPQSAVSYKIFEFENLYPRMIEAGDTYDLVDNTFTSIKTDLVTSTGEDLVNGRWVFNSQPKWPVMIVCWAYDFYAAAVDLIELWFAKIRANRQLVSISDNGQSFRWSEDLLSSLKDLRDLYTMQMCVESGHITDADSNSMPW